MIVGKSSIKVPFIFMTAVSSRSGLPSMYSVVGSNTLQTGVVVFQDPVNQHNLVAFHQTYGHITRLCN